MSQGRIPQAFIDELLARVDIVDIINQRVPLRKVGHEYSACCPFHEERTASFTVSAVKQFYHCFGCGAHGNAISFLLEQERLEFREAVAQLASDVGLQVPSSVEQDSVNTNAPLYEVLAQVVKYYQKQLKHHAQATVAKQYLQQRGLTGKMCVQFGIGFAPKEGEHLSALDGYDETMFKHLLTSGMLIQKDDGHSYARFRGRIMFPIRDRRGRVIAFGGRVVAQGMPKYLNSPQTPLFHKSEVLYGFYEAVQAGGQRLDEIYVVEGYMDVLALAQHEIRQVVATLGTAITEHHLTQLFRRTSHVICCFDGDRAGRDAAWRALENSLTLMEEGRMLSFMFLPDSEDPDSFVRKVKSSGFKKARGSALSLSHFMFDRFTQQVDLKQVDGRAKLVELLKPYLGKLPLNLFRHMIIQQLAQLVQMGVSTLERYLQTNAKAPKDAGLPFAQTKKVSYREYESSYQHSRVVLSPVQRALTIVLQYPHLQAQLEGVAWESLATLGLREAQVLHRLLSLVQDNSDLSGAELIQAVGAGHDANLLKRLSSVPCLLEEAALLTELKEAIAKTLALSDEVIWGELMAKVGNSESEPLSDEEKETIRMMLQDKID